MGKFHKYISQSMPFHIWMAANLRNAAYVEPFIWALDSIQRQTLPPHRICISLHGDAHEDGRVTDRLRALREAMQTTTEVAVFPSGSRLCCQV